MLIPSKSSLLVLVKQQRNYAYR